MRPKRVAEEAASGKETAVGGIFASKSVWNDCGVTRWVRSYWDEGDVTFYWEVRADG